MLWKTTNNFFDILLTSVFDLWDITVINSLRREYLLSLGAKLPECSPPPKPEETPMKEPEPKVEEEEEVESDVELNNEGVIGEYIFC